MTEALFLTSLLGGVASLIAAIAIARLHWRSDVAPFDRHTNAMKVLARPASYAVTSALGRIRTLAAIGYGLCGLAILCLIYQFLVNLGR